MGVVMFCGNDGLAHYDKTQECTSACANNDVERMVQVLTINSANYFHWVIRMGKIPMQLVSLKSWNPALVPCAEGFTLGLSAEQITSLMFWETENGKK
jgi:hypothetical protein